MVFDIPNIRAPFEERYEIMKTLMKENKYAKVVDQIKINNVEEMNINFNDIINKNGEGIMLRQPDSFYESKRSKTLLKVKEFQDAEAIVIGYQNGSNRNNGRLGALIVKWEDTNMGSSIFKVGSGFDDNQRIHYKTLFPIGTIITVKYFELGSLGNPRFPIYLSIRQPE
jgi:DNA ligase-1